METDEVLSRTTRRLKAPGATWENINGKVERNEGWGLPACEWEDPPQGRLGVNPGDWAIYKLSSNIVGLANISSVEWRIIRADESTGRVLFAITTERIDGIRETSLTDYIVYTGEGEVMGFIVPSMLNVGDIIYGIGRVVNISDMNIGSKVREVVYIMYQSQETQVDAIYDRKSGILLELSATSPRGMLRIDILDSSIHHQRLKSYKRG
ncbi:MAG: hypothetical protein DRJ66_03275 [Thermoprotei archaeon]|nr:MAG: hypothetical protein DRJ66_03275 [Thermoprotei archaeon]